MDTNQLIRDKKYPKRFGVLPFLGLVLVGFPVFLVVLLPAALISFLLSKVFPRRVDFKPFATVDFPPNTPSVPPLEDRKYDLVLFGATGFTGKLAVEYLAKTYSKFNNIKWAIAGRNARALQEIVKGLKATYADLEVDILVCDASQAKTLIPVVSSTRVVATTVGPYILYGNPLVHLCSVLGTSYCDITGEIEWVRSTIHKYSADAQRTGARIIHCSGHDSVPWDIVTLAIANKLKETDETLTRIEHFDDARSSPSGGTLETMMLALTLPKNKFPYDPLLNNTENSKSTNSTKISNVSFLTFSKKVKKWVGPFVMAAVNANIVRRSNALLNYSPKLEYIEGIVYPDFITAFVNFFGLAIGGTCLFIPPLRALLKKYALPKPGEGPSKEVMDKGYLRVEAYGTGSKGSKIKAVLYFPTDPGYRDTARILVETGLTLALDSTDNPIKGGVWTPAVIGEKLLKRLIDTGCEWDIQRL